MIYLDTSAIVKLIRREPESDHLLEWLDWNSVLVTSTIVDIELPRALVRTDRAFIKRIPETLSRIHRYEIDDTVRIVTQHFPHCAVAEAIHLATASGVFATMLTAFVSYDEHQLSAARTAGLPTESPRP